jgi:hypothetical protein
VRRAVRASSYHRLAAQGERALVAERPLTATDRRRSWRCYGRRWLRGRRTPGWHVPLWRRPPEAASRRERPKPATIGRFPATPRGPWPCLRPLAPAVGSLKPEGTNIVLTVILNIFSALFAILAALAWIRSSRVRKFYAGGPIPRPPGSLPQPALLLEMDAQGRQVELIGTLRRQSTWNGYAASLAAAAATFQALSIASAIFAQ